MDYAFVNILQPLCKEHLTYTEYLVVMVLIVRSDLRLI